MSMLGEALLGQGRFAEAEPLIVGGYEGMNALKAQIPPAGATPPARSRPTRLPALRGVGPSR